MSENSLTQCAIENCTCLGCGTCNACRGIDISDVPTNPTISSSTTFLGTDTFGYTMAQIAAFVSNNKPNDVITEISAEQNQVSNVDVYICTGTFDVNLLASSSATRELKIISLTGTITVNANGSDLINGSATTTVVASEALTITPYSAGWSGFKNKLF